MLKGLKAKNLHAQARLLLQFGYYLFSRAETCYAFFLYCLL